MIPKKIHYCWFGRGEKPKLAVKCIESWKKFCPDYEIIEWNEDNCDLEEIEFIKFAYENKKYAFVSDFIRLKKLYDHGGIYFDTDVEVIRRIDDLLKNEAFIGFENNENVNTGQVVGAEKENKIIKAMLDEYFNITNNDYKISFNPFGCPKLNTNALLKNGLELNGKYQELDGITVYPADYFNPLDSLTGKVNKTKNTYSIHWYSMSWLDNKTKVRSKITKFIRRIFGKNALDWLKR